MKYFFFGVAFSVFQLWKACNVSETPLPPAVSKYKDDLKIKVDTLLAKGFPDRIGKLTDLISKSQLSEKDIKRMKETLKVQVISAPKSSEDGVGTGRSVEIAVKEAPVLIPSNKHLYELTEVVKPEIKALLEDASTLKMWILLMVPSVESGNDFGVEVQQKIVEKVELTEDDASNFYDGITEYYKERADIASNLEKNPNVEDYTRAIQELDEQQFVYLQTVLRLIRNHYSLLYDIVMKNMETIKNPRKDNSKAMVV